MRFRNSGPVAESRFSVPTMATFTRSDDLRGVRFVGPTGRRMATWVFVGWAYLDLNQGPLPYQGTYACGQLSC